MPRDWAWAVAQYEGTLSGEEIAAEIGCSLTHLYKRMNRAGIRKGHRRILHAGIRRDTYDVAAVDQAWLADLESRDAELLGDVPLFRCGECGNLSSTTRCPRGHLINEFVGR